MGHYPRSLTFSIPVEVYPPGILTIMVFHNEELRGSMILLLQPRVIIKSLRLPRGKKGEGRTNTKICHQYNLVTRLKLRMNEPKAHTGYMTVLFRHLSSEIILRKRYGKSTYLTLVPDSFPPLWTFIWLVLAYKGIGIPFINQ
jgi:hypothetical protein